MTVLTLTFSLVTTVPRSDSCRLRPASALELLSQCFATVTNVHFKQPLYQRRTVRSRHSWISLLVRVGDRDIFRSSLLQLVPMLPSWDQHALIKLPTTVDESGAFRKDLLIVQGRFYRIIPMSLSSVYHVWYLWHHPSSTGSHKGGPWSPESSGSRPMFVQCTFWSK